MAKKSAPRVPETPPKRKRDKEASKQKLFQAALEVFAKQGYDAATTKEIAKKAGVSEGLIHRYYQSKAGLLLAIIMHAKEEDADNACNFPKGSFPTFSEMLAAYFKQEFAHCAEQGDFMRVAVSRSIVDSAISKQMTKHVFEGEIPDFARELAAFQKSGEIDKREDLESLALLLSTLGFSLGFFGQVVFGIPPKRLKDAADLFARALARGLAPSSSPKR